MQMQQRFFNAVSVFDKTRLLLSVLEFKLLSCGTFLSRIKRDDSSLSVSLLTQDELRLNLSRPRFSKRNSAIVLLNIICRRAFKNNFQFFFFLRFLSSNDFLNSPLFSSQRVVYKHDCIVVDVAENESFSFPSSLFLLFFF